MTTRPQCVFLDRDSIDCQDMDFSAIEQQTDFISHPRCAANEVVDKIASAEFVIVNKVNLKREHFTKLPALKLICIIATGTNNVDLEAASEHGITVCNVSDYGAPAVSQHVFLLMLSLISNFLPFQRDIEKGAWQNQDQFCLLTHPMQELKDKTLGLIGYGHIARAVENIALAFGMKVVIAHSLVPGVKQKPGRIPLQDLLMQSDVISLHCPLSDYSRDLFTMREFKQMKNSALIINAARGGIIHETDLLKALEEGEIAGAGIDCLVEEPPAADNPMITADHLPQLIITPHNAWGTFEARQRLVDGTAANIHGFLSGQIQNQVNP